VNVQSQMYFNIILSLLHFDAISWRRGGSLLLPCMKDNFWCTNPSCSKSSQ